MNEFSLIEHYFYRQAKRSDVIVGMGDDCAILTPPIGQQLAMSTDSLVAGIHFDDSFSAADIGYKSLAVNLSDLAAVGAEPAWVMLALTLPGVDETFLAGFSEGFFSAFADYPISLIGGDVTKGPLSITVQATGFTPAPLLRSGAQIGDAIYVTGELGDAVLALHYLQKKITLTPADAHKVLSRLHHPTPRISEGMQLRHIATSAIDISDGLFGDLKHITHSSKVGAKIYIDQLPISSILKKQSNALRRTFSLHSGDAYELCFTAPKHVSLPIQTSCIGEIIAGSEIVLLDNAENVLTVAGESFLHF